MTEVMGMTMRSFALILASAVTLGACVPVTPPAAPPAQSPSLSPEQAVINFREVIDRVEPVLDDAGEVEPVELRIGHRSPDRVDRVRDARAFGDGDDTGGGIR